WFSSSFAPRYSYHPSPNGALMRLAIPAGNALLLTHFHSDRERELISGEARIMWAELTLSDAPPPNNSHPVPLMPLIRASTISALSKRKWFLSDLGMGQF